MPLPATHTDPYGAGGNDSFSRGVPNASEFLAAEFHSSLSVRCLHLSMQRYSLEPYCVPGTAAGARRRQ